MRVRFLIPALILLATPASHLAAEPDAEMMRILDQGQALSPLQTIIVAHKGKGLA